MDTRTAKLALARKKLKDHQEKRGQKEDVNCQDNNNIHPSVIDSAKDNMKPSDENLEDTEYSSNDLEEKHNFSNIQMESEAKTKELLITDKINLEMEINTLRHKISQLENNYEMAITNCCEEKNKNNYLITELEAAREKHVVVSDLLKLKEKDLEDCKKVTSALSEEKTNLLEQLEFTKTVLAAKETENISLHSKVTKSQNDLEATQLLLQQLTNGNITNDNEKNIFNDHTESYVQKITVLEQQLKFAQKEHDQINSHYGHYVSELNEQLKLACARNEELAQQTQLLSTRENSLVDQISSMEIQIQNLRSFKDSEINKTAASNLNELEQQNKEFQEKLQVIQKEYDGIKQKYREAENKLKDLENVQAPETDLCISKLNADIENDKVAAQRATEQNKKLKLDLQELEKSFVKMSKDKLELTEKLDAEKFLNRELTVKLAEYVEMAKDMQIKLTAKDNEMFRLIANYRDVEGKLEELARHTSANNSDVKNIGGEVTTNINDIHTNMSMISDEQDAASNVITCEDHSVQNHSTITDVCPHKSEYNMTNFTPKQDAMVKLQERFLKIMDEVADLSDEKHRLEHIILQLQNETDTICEYVALYQQQRSLLKLRDEERSSQIKIFQAECEKMRTQLNELHEIIVKIAGDEELTTYFLKDSRQNDFANVLNLLKNMKSNFLVNSSNHLNNMKNFYPCACCSGNLIDL